MNIRALPDQDGGTSSRGPTAIAFVSLIIPMSLNRASASDLNLRLGGFVRQKGVQSKPTKPQDALLLREPHLDFLVRTSGWSKPSVMRTTWQRLGRT